MQSLIIIIKSFVIFETVTRNLGKQSMTPKAMMSTAKMSSRGCATVTKEPSSKCYELAKTSTALGAARRPLLLTEHWKACRT